MSGQLTDPYNRSIKYVRLSVMDKCDLRCFYCLPKGYKDFQLPQHWLSYAEMTRIMRVFSELGVERVRITGGEPLLRNDLPDLAGQLAAIDGIKDLSLSTNGVRLQRQAEQLRQAGVRRINVSLDSLQADRYRQITGGKLDKVLQGLQAARDAGFDSIRINMVMMKDINNDEVIDMVEYCLQQGFTLRFIETMPMGSTGRQAVDYYMDLTRVRQQLASRYELLDSVMPGGGPARYVRVAGTDLRIGFITPLSQHFCATCNRVRLSADGTLYLCLGQDDNVALAPLLRDGISDAELKQVIIDAVNRKPERHEFNEKPQQLVRFMALTGG
jgi:cyclic pyranopterin phosphate synthase